MSPGLPNDPLFKQRDNQATERSGRAVIRSRINSHAPQTGRHILYKASCRAFFDPYVYKEGKQRGSFCLCGQKASSGSGAAITW